jgi:tRNA A37 threonylcarbamoyladenosine synthetase subunit TsaC/SUA5/YrdC
MFGSDGGQEARERLDVEGEEPEILRTGPITAEQINQILAD